LSFFDRTADQKTRVLALKERAGRREARVGCKVVVAVIVIRAAVKLVGAGSGDDIYGAGRGDARGGVEVQRRELKLLHNFLREVHRGAAFHLVVDDSAVHGQPRTYSAAGGRARRGSENADIEHSVKLRGAARRNGDAGFQRRQLQGAAAVQWEVLNRLALDDSLDGVAVIVDRDRRGLHRDDLRGRARHDVDIECCRAAGDHLRRGHYRAKARLFHAHFVFGRQKRGSVVYALGVCRLGPHRAGGFVGDGYSYVGNHRSGRVGDGT